MGDELETCRRCGQLDAKRKDWLGKPVCDWCWTEEDQEIEDEGVQD